MGGRQVKLQEFLTSVQVEANVLNRNVSRRLEKVSGFTAIIVKLNPPTFGRCSLCQRWAVLSFCLEYLDSNGAIESWGEVCASCVAKTMGEKRK